jgi:hypothetical protein
VFKDSVAVLALAGSGVLVIGTGDSLVAGVPTHIIMTQITMKVTYYAFLTTEYFVSCGPGRHFTDRSVHRSSPSAIALVQVSKAWRPLWISKHGDDLP